MANSVLSGRQRQRGNDLHQRGARLLVEGRVPEALDLLRKATQAAPRHALAWHDLGEALRLSDRVDEAKQAVARAIELAPRSLLSARLFAQLLIQQGRYREAAKLLHPAAVMLPEEDELAMEAANALLQDERADLALKLYLRAATRTPQDARVHLGMALAFTRMSQPAHAAECSHTAELLDPDCAQILSIAAYQSLHAVRWDGLEARVARLERLIGAGRPAMPFETLTLPGISAAAMRRAATAYGIERAKAVRPLPARAARPLDAGSARLRIGYVSNDFFDHATAHLLVEVIERHDRHRFEVHLYCYSKDDGTAIRQRILAAADVVTSIAALDDRAAAERIAADEIDILVDLKGYTLGCRPAIFAHRPAPVQVNYLGFPGTLGVPWIDYIVTDPIVAPPGACVHLAEQPAYMPDAYQPNDRQRALPPPPARADCGLPEGAFVFCSFNATYKITPTVFDLWCRILQQAPNAVLWLLESSADAATRLRAQAQARGVDPARLVFAPRVAVHRHLARTQLADLVLDTLPVNAHTTAADALWAGVPVLTCPGDAFVSRVAASLVTAVGLPELVMPDLAAYERKAVRLATQPRGMAVLRKRLAEQRLHCALFDSARYTQALESLFTQMHERALGGQAPAPLQARP